MQHWIKLSTLVLATGIASTALFTTPPVQAEDASPSTQPAREAKRTTGKLVKQWTPIEDSLTPEQKSAILAIHQKANEDVNAIHKKEEADIMALLKPEQIEELKTATEKAKAEEKAKAAEKRDAAKKAKE